MAFGSGLGPAFGGGNSRLNVAAATIIKVGSGQYWSAEITSAGSNTGYLYDSATIAGATAATILAIVPANALGPTPYAEPRIFFNGLVFIPASDMTANIFFT